MSAQATQLAESSQSLRTVPSPATPQPVPATLHSLARKSLGYLVLRYGLSMLINIGNMLVLTWWIGPHAYGIFVTAVALTTFLSSLTRFGVDTYLVRCDNAPEDDHYHVASTITLGLSIAFVLLGAAAVPLLVRWYSATEFVAPYLVLLTTVPMIGMAGPPFARMERELDFRAVSAIELGGQLTAFLTALVLAILGRGVWAPVGGFVLWQIVTLVAACSRTRYVPKWKFEWRMARSMLEFGFGFSASLRAWQLRTLVNPLLVGRFAGPEAVAYIGLAIRIAEALSFARTAAGRLAIAGLARLQHDRDRFRSALQESLEIQVASLGPLLCCFAICGPWMVSRFLGSRWLPALDVFAFVAAGVLVNSVFNLQASALFVIGRQWPVMRAYALHVALLAAGTALLVPHLGIRGYGWAELLACFGYALILISLRGVVGLSYRRLLLVSGVFLLPLLLDAAAIRHRAAWWLPISLVPGLLVCLTLLPIRTASAQRWRAAADPHWEHLLTFVSKTRQRGFQYVGALLRYQCSHIAYRTSKAIIRHHERRRRLRPLLDSAAFHFSADEIPGIVASVPPSLKESVIEEADRAMRHQFRFRGQERQFAGDVDWFARPEGSVSWQWDLNRHLFFLRLGTAYYYTGSQKYLEELVDLWTNWIESNPEGTGNWQQPFEVAARLQNWIWAYFLLAYSARVAQFDLSRFAGAIRQHADFLGHHLEYHWPNNHLLLESKALYEYALLFPQLDQHRSHLRHARRVLLRQIASQVLDDGAHAELSSMYHRVIAGELWEMAHLAQRTGDRCSLDARLIARIARMSEFSQAMTRPDGTVPLLGDSAQNDTYIRFDSVQRHYSDLNFWLHRTRRPRNAPTQERLEIFREAGYVFLRSADRNLHLTFDCGPLSRCECRNHAHCDALSFELYCHGVSWIVDPGVYFPWPSPRDSTGHFRSTAAHNTLTIDGKEQSELCDTGDVKRAARVELVSDRETPGEVSVTGECIPYWSDGTTAHRRQISLISDNQIRIRDEVVGSGDHRLDWTFHFAPEIDVEVQDGSLVTTNAGDAGLRVVRINSSATRKPEINLFRGSCEPLRGWVSRNSAQVLPATAAVFSLQTRLPIAIEFVIDVLP